MIAVNWPLVTLYYYNAFKSVYLKDLKRCPVLLGLTTQRASSDEMQVSKGTKFEAIKNKFAQFASPPLRGIIKLWIA